MSIYAHTPNEWTENKDEIMVVGYNDPKEPALTEKAFKAVEFANEINNLISNVWDTLFGEEERKSESEKEIESVSDCLSRTNDKLYECITRLQHLSKMIGLNNI